MLSEADQGMLVKFNKCKWKIIAKKYALLTLPVMIRTVDVNLMETVDEVKEEDEEVAEEEEAGTEEAAVEESAEAAEEEEAPEEPKPVAKTPSRGRGRGRGGRGRK